MDSAAFVAVCFVMQYFSEDRTGPSFVIKVLGFNPNSREDRTRVTEHLDFSGDADQARRLIESLIQNSSVLHLQVPHSLERVWEASFRALREYFPRDRELKKRLLLATIRWAKAPDGDSVFRYPQYKSFGVTNAEKILAFSIFGTTKKSFEDIMQLMIDLGCTFEEIRDVWVERCIHLAPDRPLFIKFIRWCTKHFEYRAHEVMRPIFSRYYMRILSGEFGCEVPRTTVEFLDYLVFIGYQSATMIDFGDDSLRVQLTECISYGRMGAAFFLWNRYSPRNHHSYSERGTVSAFSSLFEDERIAKREDIFFFYIKRALLLSVAAQRFGVAAALAEEIGESSEEVDRLRALAREHGQSIRLEWRFVIREDV
ncbi:hypothetical protein KBD61_06295 [Patescibacteria group bacterium]|nr:hypothetical protein [Patescibacteria group bacterium]MBP9710597.1 hypothetical protein [Patescibacteria group bacterium]